MNTRVQSEKKNGWTIAARSLRARCAQRDQCPGRGKNTCLDGLSAKPSPGTRTGAHGVRPHHVSWRDRLAVLLSPCRPSHTKAWHNRVESLNIMQTQWTKDPCGIIDSAVWRRGRSARLSLGTNSQLFSFVSKCVQYCVEIASGDRHGIETSLCAVQSEQRRNLH